MPRKNQEPETAPVQEERNYIPVQEERNYIQAALYLVAGAAMFSLTLLGYLGSHSRSIDIQKNSTAANNSTPVPSSNTTDSNTEEYSQAGGIALLLLLTGSAVFLMAWGVYTACKVRKATQVAVVDTKGERLLFTEKGPGSQVSFLADHSTETPRGEDRDQEMLQTRRSAQQGGNYGTGSDESLLTRRTI